MCPDADHVRSHVTDVERSCQHTPVHSILSLSLPLAPHTPPSTGSLSSAISNQTSGHPLASYQRSTGTPSAATASSSYPPLPEASSFPGTTSSSCPSLPSPILPGASGGVASSSLASSINDLTFEAEQLERAIRLNDPLFVRRMLELHHGKFSVNLHESLLDKSSCGSQSQCVSQDVEILLRKSQTLLERFDRRGSVSTEDQEECPPAFSSALHLAVDSNAVDVARLLLKYGVEPNEPGVALQTTGLSTSASGNNFAGRRGSCSTASVGEENVTASGPPLTANGRRVSHLLSPGRYVSPSGPQPENIGDNAYLHYPPTYHQKKGPIVVRPELDLELGTVYMTPEGSRVCYDEYYGREVLYSLPPLYLAVALGNAAMVYLLVKYGAAVNFQDRYGVTPLHLALCQDKVPWGCARLLLEYGARVNLANNRAVTPAQLVEQDMGALQGSLVEGALSCFVPPPSSPGALHGPGDETPTASTGPQGIPGPLFKGHNFLMRRFQNSDSKSRQSNAKPRRDYLLVDDVSPEGVSCSSFHSSVHSRHSNRSVLSRAASHEGSCEPTNNHSSAANTPAGPPTQAGTPLAEKALQEKGSCTYLPPCGVSLQGHGKLSRKTTIDETASLTTPKESLKSAAKRQTSTCTSDSSEMPLATAETCLQTLIKMAANPECLEAIVVGLQGHLAALIELSDQMDGSRIHKPFATLLTRLLQTAVDDCCPGPGATMTDSSREKLSGLVCRLLPVGVGCLRGGQSMQYTGLLTINKLIDVSVVHGLTHVKVKKSSRPVHPVAPQLGKMGVAGVAASGLIGGVASMAENVLIGSTGVVASAVLGHHLRPSSLLPWRIKSEGEPTSHKWWSPGSGKTSAAKEAEVEEAKAFRVDTPTENVLDVLSSGTEILLSVLNNAITLHKRVVGTRQHCTHGHRWRYCSYHCLQILSARCLLYMSQSEEIQRKLAEEGHLKILASALDSTNDPQLLCLALQIGATLALKPCHHEALQEADFPDCITQLVLPSDEWYYTNHSTKYARFVKHHAARILVYMGHEQRLRNKVYLFDLLEQEATPPTTLVDSQEDTYILQTSLAPPTVRDRDDALIGASLEAVILEMLKNCERELCGAYNSDQDPNDSRGYLSLTPDSSLYYLSTLPVVADPLIVLRLLQHRLMGGLVHRHVVGGGSRGSVSSATVTPGPSESEDSLRLRRKVNLTINCSTPPLDRRSSIKSAAPSLSMVSDTRVVIQSALPVTSVTLTMTQPLWVKRGSKDKSVASERTSASTEATPNNSPTPHKRGGFRFASLRRKKAKLATPEPSLVSESDSLSTSAADIAAFQRELQNLPDFDCQVTFQETSCDVPLGRPRSCSVPRVTFDSSTQLQLPGGSHAHGPLIRSATTEAAYLSCNTSRSPSNVSPGQTRRPSESPRPTELNAQAVLQLVQDWASRCPHDLLYSAAICREMREFLGRASCLGDQYRWWAESVKITLDLEDNEPTEDARDDEQEVDEEYQRLQQIVVSGELPCSKEEASVLAGIQLRIEESWPSPSSTAGRRQQHQAGAQAITDEGRNPVPPAGEQLKLKPISEDDKETAIPEVSRSAPGSGGGGSGGGKGFSSMESCNEGSLAAPSGVVTQPPGGILAGLRAPKRGALIRQWLVTNGNKPLISASTGCSLELKDCLPPLYHNTKNMARNIKDQKRKLFHSHVYESEIHLKKLYIQTCKRLPAYDCKIFQVKELLRGKTKKRATRLLGLGAERILLLDSKTLLPAKCQLTSDLQQWRTGGGRSHDRLVLEFRGTKWSFITPSQGALRSISTVLWEIMQDWDGRFLEDHVISAKDEILKESKRNLTIIAREHGPTIYRLELEKLQSLLHFPEEVALQLTETEYSLFYSVPPASYVRQVTVDLSGGGSPPKTPMGHDPTVQVLIKRFNEVNSWVTHIIISQPTHEDRKAVLSCFLRVAKVCWNLGNFNTAMEILAGLKSEKLKPFWLSVSDPLPTLDHLSSVLLAGDYPSPEYRKALERALDIPQCKLIPFFGGFLRELRAVLQGMPSLVVLPGPGAQKLEFVSDYHGEDHFMTRIGVGGILNMDKLERTHQVLEDIEAFHLHAKYRPGVVERLADHQARMQEPGQFTEEDSHYLLTASAYKPIQPLSSDHKVSFIPLGSESLDVHLLQTMHHGATVVHWDEDGSRSAICYLKLEAGNLTLTWCKPLWSSLRVSGAQDFCLSADIEDSLSPGLLLKYEGSQGDSMAMGNLEEGYLDLSYVKDVTLGQGTADLIAVSKRHGLDDLYVESNCFRLTYGTGLSDNHALEFVAPSKVARVWYEGLNHLIFLLGQQKKLSDKRIQWLKEKYLHLYFEDQACLGPTPAEAIKVFGGRKWTLGSLGTSSISMDVSMNTFKRASSFGVGSSKLRKKKSSVSLAAIRDGNFSDDVPLRKQSPNSKLARGAVKSSPQLGLRDSGPHSLPWATSSPPPDARHKGNLSPSSNSSSNSSDHVFRSSKSKAYGSGRQPLGSPVFQSSSLSPTIREKYRQRFASSFVQRSESDPSRLPRSAPSLASRPTITHSSQMDFLEFTELYRSFMVRSRKDLKDVFEQIASAFKTSTATTPTQERDKLPPESPDLPPPQLLGLLTRNTPFDMRENNQRKKICDAIAAASIVANSAGMETSKTIYLSVKDFQNFLATHQGETYTEDEVLKFIYRWEPDHCMRKKNCLSFEGFARYMMDKDNYAFVPESQQPKDEDMDYPMSYYYLASSHNTYLTGHQLKGESSVELYSQVLLTGCRCVELDCWDGDDGIPVIYHGHTLTTKIPFKNVVEAINKSAFVTSPYPVILSIENHCSMQQQAKMAQIFINVFGDKLVTKFLFESDFVDEPQLPSPNQLKYRILIKNKKLRLPLTPALGAKARAMKSTPGRTNSLISTASTGSLNDDDDDDYEYDDDDDDILEETIPAVTKRPDHSTGDIDRHSTGTVSKSASLTVRPDSLSSQEGLSSSYNRALSPVATLRASAYANSSGVKSVPSTTVTSSDRETFVPMGTSLPSSIALQASASLAAEIWHADEDIMYKPRKSSSQIAPELSDLVVYCQAIKFRGFVTNPSPNSSVKLKKYASKKNVLATSSSITMPNTPPMSAESKAESTPSKRSAACYQVSSVNESTAKKLCKRHPLALVAHCEQQLMRTYPAGMRIDSSNFNPVIFWAFGMQMVALNYQTEDAALHINTAMFEQRGKCGFVLKPRVMWDHTHMMYGRFNPWDKEFDGLHSITLHITVISGQCVCPSTHTGSPQIELEIVGIPVDCQRQKTKLVQRNSLNPIWNDSFQFRVTFSDLAFLRFSVSDMGTSHVTAQRVIPLKSLRQGYRHVRLRSPQNQPLQLSTLFVNSHWEEEGLEMSSHSASNGRVDPSGHLYETGLTSGGTISSSLSATATGAKKNLLKGKSKDSPIITGEQLLKADGKENQPSSISVKRRMFFLVVHGVVPDEPGTIVKITQDSTTREVILQSLAKGSKSGENPDDYILIEEVSRGWEKKTHEKSGANGSGAGSHQRILDPDEHPLEAQAHWQGEGRFVLKKLGNDPSTRAWVSTLQSSTNKKLHEQDLTSDDWDGPEETFLVCVYNVSPEQPYAILKAPVTSRAQDILAQALVKARRMEDPSSFVLVEEVDYSSLAETNPGGSMRMPRGHRGRKDSRVLHDDENVYEVQSRWKAQGRFELKTREEMMQEKKRASFSKASSFSRLSRLRSSSKTKETSSGGSSKPSASRQSSTEGHTTRASSRTGSLNADPTLQQPQPSPLSISPKRPSGDSSNDDNGDALRSEPSTVAKLKSSLCKLRVWR